MPTPKDEATSDLMRTYWTNFPKTGDPNGARLPSWPDFSNAKPRKLYIASGSTKAVPAVDEDGLKALAQYFAWRRSTEALWLLGSRRGLVPDTGKLGKRRDRDLLPFYKRLGH